MKTKRKVVGYVRVSTLDQRTGLESQVRAVKNLCQLRDFGEIEFFADEGISGAKSSRPSLDRLMQAVENGEIETVIVYSFSRMARSVSHLLKVLEKFDKYDVNFVSLTEQLDTKTPSGRAIYTILGAVSQLERELIAERVKNGLANARAKGIHIGRKKTRPSKMIRMLLKKGLKYKEISSLCETSHGSINCERKEMLAEEKAEKEAAEKLKENKICSTNEEQTKSPQKDDGVAESDSEVISLFDFKKNPNPDNS